jgi:hypothetical protein
MLFEPDFKGLTEFCASGFANGWRCSNKKAHPIAGWAFKLG